MSDPYIVGTTVRVTGTFRNAAGNLADPSTVRFKYQKPGASVTTLVYGTDAALVKSSTGVYYVDLDVAAGEHGMWGYRYESTGNPHTAAESSFAVLDSAFD